jgi:retinoblastoma-like protein 1
MPCSSKKLFEFVWCLFICGKAEYPEHSVDMVTSVNMLICCLDVIFSNAIDDKRTDIVQSSFSGEFLMHSFFFGRVTTLVFS